MVQNVVFGWILRFMVETQKLKSVKIFWGITMPKRVPKYPGDNLREILFYIKTDLNQREERRIKFLLRDVLGKSLLEKDILTIFNSLTEKNIIKDNDPWLMIECLRTIDRVDLIKKCFPEITRLRDASRPTGQISRFRHVLYQVGVNLNDDDRKTLAFLFDEAIPKDIQQSFGNSLDLMMFLQEKSIISETDTSALQEKLKAIDSHYLVDKLVEFHNGAPPTDQVPFSDERLPVPDDQHLVRVKHSVIKGFHEYLNNPPVSKEIPVYHEIDNGFDKNACMVCMPDSTRICRKQDGKVILVEDITDKQVGHVPGNLSSTFKSVIDSGCEIYAQRTGKPCLSFPPWPDPYSKGGGVVIPCDYVVRCPGPEEKRHVYRKLKDVLDGLTQKGLDVMELE